MALTRDVVVGTAAEYADSEPLYAVEAENIETLPGAFEAGDYGWRDAAWVVRWYYRRSLGGIPDEQRRAGEAAFGENDFEAVRAAIDSAVAAPGRSTKLGALTDLEGVDVPVASAFLLFIHPQQFIVVGDREWTALALHDHLDRTVSEAISEADYGTYLRTCRTLRDRFDCSLWTLYRALWRLGAPSDEHRG